MSHNSNAEHGDPASAGPRIYRAWVPVAWLFGVSLFAVPVLLQSLATETQTPSSVAASGSGAAGLVLGSLTVVAVAALVLAFSWNAIVRRIGNAGLATIGMIAGLQFTVSYLARLVGAVLGAMVGPYYLFVDGIGSKGLSCLFLGVLITLLPLPGVLSLALLTLFLLNVITTGQLGLMSLLFIGVTVALHEALAAAAGVTLTRGDATNSSDAARWSFALRVGLAIGCAQGVALYAQYGMYEMLLRQHFDLWYKLAASIVTGFVYSGIGAMCGAMLGFRLRRTAP